MRIAFLGNFTEFSTETDLAWTMEWMGHEVQRIQDHDRDGTFNFANVDLFWWVHTHGWDHAHGVQKLFKHRAVPTVSFHLDRFWGLNKLDGREDKIGVHPFWKSDFVFTADGGNQERFKERGVNHFWSPPAIAEQWCFRGNFDSALSCDIAFVGSEQYHPEYPFRGELVKWLRDTYGSNFKHIQGMRGEKLNDLYASCPVIVGDSCFAGADRYCSDRVFETVGRGGLLVHPYVPGLDFGDYLCYKPQDLDSLKYMIENAQAIYRDSNVRDVGINNVLAKHTYIQRLEAIFAKVFRTEGI